MPIIEVLLKVRRRLTSVKRAREPYDAEVVSQHLIV